MVSNRIISINVGVSKRFVLPSSGRRAWLKGFPGTQESRATAFHVNRLGRRGGAVMQGQVEGAPTASLKLCTTKPGFRELGCGPLAGRQAVGRPVCLGSPVPVPPLSNVTRQQEPLLCWRHCQGPADGAGSSPDVGHSKASVYFIISVFNEERESCNKPSVGGVCACARQAERGVGCAVEGGRCRCHFSNREGRSLVQRCWEAAGPGSSLCVFISFVQTSVPNGIK